MRKIYSICLLFMISVFSLSYYTSYQISKNREQQIAKVQTGETEPVIKVDNISEIHVTKSMDFIKESYNLDTEVLEEKREDVPIALLGLTREEVIDYLKGLSKDGISYELMSFSEGSIRIRETIKDLPPNFACYLINENGYLLVYDKTDGESYLATYISIEEFPMKEQEELMKGKGFDSMVELYNYLESHTS